MLEMSELCNGQCINELCDHKYQLMLSRLVMADKWFKFPRGSDKTVISVSCWELMFQE